MSITLPQILYMLTLLCFSYLVVLAMSCVFINPHQQGSILKQSCWQDFGTPSFTKLLWKIKITIFVLMMKMQRLYIINIKQTISLSVSCFADVDFSSEETVFRSLITVRFCLLLAVSLPVLSESVLVILTQKCMPGVLATTVLYN